MSTDTTDEANALPGELEDVRKILLHTKTNNNFYRQHLT